MPTFQSDASSNTFTGSQNYAGASITIPSGATVQEFAETDGSLVWIQPSGQFAVYFAASGWMMADTAVGAAAPSMDPDDASVSGWLAYWYNEDSWDLLAAGQSGIQSATSQDPLTGDQAADRNTPYVASGEVNSLDALYCYSNKAIYDTGPQQPSIGLMQGSDAPHTFFAVCKPETTHLGNVFSLCRTVDNNDGQRNWGCHSNGTFYYFERDDVNGSDWKNIGAFGTAQGGGVYSPGEVFLMTFATSADGLTMRAYKNGTEFTDAASGLNTGQITPVDLGVGVNSRSSLDQNFVGMICEIAVYASGLGDSDREKLEEGLKTKWGIS